jgi:hypothetical protein
MMRTKVVVAVFLAAILGCSWAAEEIANATGMGLGHLAVIVGLTIIDQGSQSVSILELRIQLLVCISMVVLR